MKEFLAAEKRKIENLSLFKNALEMYNLCGFKSDKRRYFSKWLCFQNWIESFRKFKIRYPQATDSEINNFAKIYLSPLYYDNTHDLVLEDETCFLQFFWVDVT